MVPLSRLARENLNFSLEPLTLHGTLDNERNETWLEGLLDKIIGAVFHRLHCPLDGSIGSDNHHGNPVSSLPDRLQGFEAVHIGELDIEENHLRAFFIQECQSLFSSQGRDCSVTQRLQPVF